MSQTNTPPPAAKRSAATPSTFRLARRNMLLLFGAILLIAGLLMLVIGLGLVWSEGRFASDGRTATGLVIGKAISRATAGSSDSSTDYIVRYRFTDIAGRQVDGSDEIGFDAWEALTEGGPVEVSYLAQDPGTNRVAGGDGLTAAVIVLVIGFVVTAVGAPLTIRGWRGVSRTRRLWRDGTPATGTVTQIEQTNVQFNRERQWRIRYRYADEAGATHDGESGYMSYEEASQWQTGSSAMVRYDPRKPGVSVWIGAQES